MLLKRLSHMMLSDYQYIKKILNSHQCYVCRIPRTDCPACDGSGIILSDILLSILIYRYNYSIKKVSTG